MQINLKKVCTFAPVVLLCACWINIHEEHDMNEVPNLNFLKQQREDLQKRYDSATLHGTFLSEDNYWAALERVERKIVSHPDFIPHHGEVFYTIKD